MFLFPTNLTLLSNFAYLAYTFSIVSIPYEFTLLSNTADVLIIADDVSIPYEFTLLKHTVAPCRQVPRFYSLRIYTTQTAIPCTKKNTEFLFPTNLHYFKLPSSRIKPLYVSIPYEFTLLSNTGMPQRISHQFLFPTNLHYSQTMSDSDLHDLSFYSLRIYTTLKQKDWGILGLDRFYSLRIYTTLKQPRHRDNQVLCFYSLRIYTTLKRRKTPALPLFGFSLRIYTTLKQAPLDSWQAGVSIPYEFTLLKPCRYFSFLQPRFYSLRIYTTLKPV